MPQVVLPLAPRTRRRRLLARAHGDPSRARAGADAPAPQDARAPARAAAPHAPFRMLIVDDDPLMTDMLPRRLRRVLRDNVDIRTAATPDEAADIIRELQPDAILSDYNLRQMRTGLDVLREAEQHAPNAARILFSGHAAREIDGLQDASVHAYIEKPMRLDELVTPVLEAIERATGQDLRG